MITVNLGNLYHKYNQFNLQIFDEAQLLSFILEK